MPNKQMKTLTIGGETYEIHDEVARSKGGGFSDTAKQALLNLLEHVAYIDEDGQDYLDALEAALTTKTLISISAVFTQGQAVIYDTDSLDSLKQYLVVTANYDDGSSAEVTTYTLSGTLTVGTSTISVSYSGKSATFEVTVTAAPTLESISAVFTQGQTVVYDTDSLDSLKSMLVVTATYSDSSTETVDSADYTLSGTLEDGPSTVTVSYEGETTTFRVTVTGVTLFEGKYAETTSLFFSNSSTNLVYFKDSTTGNRITYILDGTGDHAIPKANTSQTNQTIYPIPIPVGASKLVIQKDTNDQGTLTYIAKWANSKWTAQMVAQWGVGRHVIDISAINDGSLYVGFTSRNTNNDSAITTDDRTNWSYGWV